MATLAPELQPPFPGARWTAPYAVDPATSRGRIVPEAPSATRSPFQRDRDRIIHATAFRRLKQKTQVFVAHEGDHYRTRLTHSLEVSQIARSLARTLGLDEDLAETLALAHDLGHTPFGHAGERAMQAAMTDFGGFDHNAQTLRIVTALEGRYAAFDGLNLTWETLEGVVKHNGPLLTPETSEVALPWALTAYPHWRGLELDTFPSLEAQVAALADDIAYNNHDIDDGLAAGLFTIADVSAVPFVGAMFAEVEARHPGLDRARLVHETNRRLIGMMVEDALRETRRRLADADPRSADAVRRAGRPLVAFSEEFLENLGGLRAFLWTHMYRHPKVNRAMAKAQRVVRELFAAFLADPDVLPPEWRVRAAGPGAPETARAVCDYVAGMTDRFAIEEHRRMFSISEWS